MMRATRWDKGMALCALRDRQVSSGSSGTSEKLERMREEGRRRVLARKLEQEKMIENNNPTPTTTQ